MNGPSCAFDERRNLMWSTDGLGRTAYAYDQSDRLTAATYPDGTCLGLRYDDVGRLVERRSPGGARESFVYDPAGRLTSARHPQGAVTGFVYDEAGRPVEARAPSCVTRYTYDGAGWPVQGEQTLAGTTSETKYAYDESGYLRGVHVPGFAPWVRYAYDDRRRLVSLGHDGAPDLIRISYDDDGVTLRCANGVTQRLLLDQRGQARRIRLTSSTGEDWLDLLYRSDPSGNVTAIGDERFTYDSRGRLVEHGPLLGSRSTYAYDAAGNRVARRPEGQPPIDYRYDEGGRLARAVRADDAITRYAYGGEGQLAARSDGRGNWAYQYDGAGRLARVTRNRELVAEYVSDHTGRLVFKRRGAFTVAIHRDPWGSRIAETDSDGETRVFVGPAGQPMVVLVIRDGHVATWFLHADHLGSVRAVTDERGKLVARFDFDPFGQLEITPEAIGREGVGPWARVFAGHPYDDDLGFYAAGVRWYDPEIGRFTTADSYTFAADDARLLWLSAAPAERQALRAARLRAWQHQTARRNRYAYALNNPLTYVDRDGHNGGLYFLYVILGIFWALPYTVAGFLIFEVILNWLTFAFAWSGDHSLKGESSDRLGAWALWSIGGLSGKMVIGGGAFTLGNFVIANGPFFNNLNTTTKNFGIPTHLSEFDPFSPASATLLTAQQSAVEHELRHTNQYGWWGPFMMPWVLIFYLIVAFVVLSIRTARRRQSFTEFWGTFLRDLTDKWWKVAIEGVAVLLLPGSYWWDYIVRGGYGNSWFEQDAAQNSGFSNLINVRAAASRDNVAPGGTVTVTVISDPSNVPAATLAVTTNASGAPAPIALSISPVSNLKAFRYTAGPNKGIDKLTAQAGGDSFTLDIKVQ